MTEVTLTGVVRTGKKLGRTFNIPTANIDPVEDISALSRGVYYSSVTVDGKDYDAMTNLGVRPTVASGGQVNAESFIFGFEGDLYGKEIKVTLKKFRRGEKKFDDISELFDTIETDLREGAAYFGIEYPEV